MNGDPRCRECNGRGGVFRSGRWHKCDCTRMTSAKRAIQRKLNESPGHEYTSVMDRLREQQEGK